MERKELYLAIGFLSLSLSVMIPGTADAQINNRPFQFNNGTGGLGMSQAGRQAIINEELFDERPKSLLRNFDGQLLSVDKGRGNSAIVRYYGTQSILPAYRGEDFRGGNEGMRVGVFNSYFIADSNGSSAYYPSASMLSRETVNTWTGRVVADGTAMQLLYGTGYSTIDSWTGQIFMLNNH